MQYRCQGAEKDRPQDQRDRPRTVSSLANSAQCTKHDQPAYHTRDGADPEFLHESPRRMRIRRVRTHDRGGHGNHECDPSWVVESRLAFQNCSCAARASAIAQYRVDGRRIGRSECDCDQRRDRPVEPQYIVSREREPRGRQDRSKDSKGENRARSQAGVSEAGAKAALEQDHEQRDRPDFLERYEGQIACRSNPEQTRADSDS